MQTFRTEIQPASLSTKIRLADPVLTIGSCFAENIGKKLEENKFAVCNQPFGTVFNPVSIARLIALASGKEKLDPSGFVQSEGVFHHYDFHSGFWAYTKKDLKDILEAKLAKTRGFLARVKWVVITLGTAWVYARKDTGALVANCHKIPQSEFSKRLLSNDEVVFSLRRMLEYLPADCHIVLTVSPVRHLKDTLVSNSVSKATLRLATHLIQESHPQIAYFPAFELMMDDLRDYRFYNEDMLHPSAPAVDYIWQKFKEAAIDTNALTFMDEWGKISRMLDHKPLHPGSSAHKNFLNSLLERLKQIHQVDVTTEQQQVMDQLKAFWG